MTSADQLIVLENVSKFYGEVLGVNRVSLEIAPGITSLVGPNGSGKSTLLNLMTGLLQPTRGRVAVLGLPTNRPEELFRLVGYCTQFEGFPRGVTGRRFIESFLRIGGWGAAEATSLADEAIERVGMAEAADRRIASYSKGMRQRIKLAQALAHRPSVLILDEPLNGLDPIARADVMGLFQRLAAEGLHVVVSSHILHEVETMSERVVLLNGGYVIAEGDISSVRGEMGARHPLKLALRCAAPGMVASKLVRHDHVVSLQLHDDRRGMWVTTTDLGAFYELLNRLVIEGGISLDSVEPADDDMQSVYRYLIDDGGDL